MNTSKTERIAIFAVTAAIMAIAFSATIAVTTQQAEAVKSGRTQVYCYQTTLMVERCFPNHGECNKEQTADPTASSGCYRQTIFH